MAGRTSFAALVVVLGVVPALAYMEYPPETMQKLCKSPRIRLLKVSKVNLVKGGILFELVENLNSPNDVVKSVMAEKIPGPDDPVKQFRQAFPVNHEATKPIFDWAATDRKAVLFTLENGGKVISERACGYMFLDEQCYSVVYNKAGDYWAFIRSEPQMSACYFGKVDPLIKFIKDVLAGKEVQVPTKKPSVETDSQKRSQEIFDALNTNK